MKFGLEIEKFLFDLKNCRPSDGVFRFIDALSDLHHESVHITNEFVLNMVEIVTDPSTDPMDVIKDYIRNYLMFNTIANRESVSMVGMGALPMDYQPHMLPKWPYFVQNSILDKKMEHSYTMTKDSPLTPAGNCAGIHIHAEIETLPEYLFSTRELQDKFNLGLMMTPMIAFASSPYFFGKHDSSSMRAQRYFNGVYSGFPLNGGLPHVMSSSEEVLKFFQFSTDHWIHAGIAAGLPEEALKKLYMQKGANWSPVRWNRTWNTIEFRTLDSDRIDLDCAKFIWVCGAMKRSDLKGEALRCVPLEEEPLSDKMIDSVFNVKDGEVTILPTLAIKELFSRAIKDGLRDSLVQRYLQRLSLFARVGIDEKNGPVFDILQGVLDSKLSTSEAILETFGRKDHIDNMKAMEIVNYNLEEEKKIMEALMEQFPVSSNRREKFLKSRNAKLGKP